MSTDQLLDKATQLLDEGSYIEAEIALKRVLKKESDNTQALKLIAELAVKCDQPKTAVKYFEQYIKLTKPDLETSLSIADFFTRRECCSRPESCSAMLFSSHPTMKKSNSNTCNMRTTQLTWMFFP